MNQEQYQQFLAAPHEPTVASVHDLTNRSPRTLIFGDITERATFHVYLGEDQLIHVLLYENVNARKRGVDSEPKFLIINHSAGESGGVTGSGEYVPHERVYPESCDLEFCNVLRRDGYSISFTNFDDSANATRLEAFGGFAGYTFGTPGGCQTYSLHEHLAAHPGFPPDQPWRGRRLTSRLAAQAARELGVPFTSSSDGTSVTVAAEGSDKVLERARDFLRDLVDADIEPGVGKRIAEQAFGAYHQFGMCDENFHHGNVTATVSLGHVDFVADSSHQLFIGKPDGYYEKGILGSHSGRPFFACKSKQGEAFLAYSQFGDTDSFLQEQLHQFSLTPLSVD